MAVILQPIIYFIVNRNITANNIICNIIYSKQ